MVLGQSIVNDQGQLKLVGCGKPDPNNPYGTLPESVRAYDLASGAGNVLCDITETLMNPVVAAKDGTIFVYSASNRTAFYRVQGGKPSSWKRLCPISILPKRANRSPERLGIFCEISTCACWHP